MNLLLIIFILITLGSVYFPVLSLAPFPILGFILLLIKTRKVFIPHYLIVISIFIALLFPQIIHGIVRTSFNFHIPTLLGVLMGPILFLMILSKRINHSFIGAIKILLLFHIIFFYLQLLIFYIFNIEVNYLKFLGAIPSRNQGFGFLTGHIRASGLFNEPATYAQFVFAILTCYKEFSKKDDLLSVLSIISLFLTFSISGIVLGFTYLFFNFYDFIKKYLIYSILLIGSIGLTLFNFFRELFLSRFGNGLLSDNSLNQRFGQLINSFNFFELEFWLGYGLGYTPDFVDTSVGSGYSLMFISGGIIFLFIWLSLFWFVFTYFQVSWKLRFYFFILLMTTLIFTRLHFWLFLSLYCLSSKTNDLHITEE